MTSSGPVRSSASRLARAAILACSLAAAGSFWFQAGTSAQVQAPSPVLAPARQDPATPPFDQWLAALRVEAVARGISQRTVDAALGHIEPLQVVIERDRTQAELTLTFDQYVKRRLTKRLVNSARDRARENATVLHQVTAQYGVAGSVIVAIWGLESNFGRFSGTWPTIAALATLAYDPHRPALFREELFSALEIVDRQDIDPAALKGSWAGAMGQPQFMPSSFLRYAADFDGDGKKDIWGTKGDVFASIASFLREHGWTPGLRWGREVRLNDATAERVAAQVPIRVTGSCQAARQMTEPRPVEQWRTLGVTQLDGKPLPGKDLEASLVRVDTHAFLAYGNYEALLGYNCAHAYALSVGILADRIGGN